MSRVALFFNGYAVLLGGVLLALGRAGVLASIGTVWTVIAVVILLGGGIMFAGSFNRSSEIVEIDRKQD